MRFRIQIMPGDLRQMPEHHVAQIMQQLPKQIEREAIAIQQHEEYLAQRKRSFGEWADLLPPPEPRAY